MWRALKESLSTWLSDCAANAETLRLPQLHARCALCRSVYLCGRPRALRDPAQNMPIKRTRRAPSSFRGDIFQSLGKTWGKKHATIHPWWPRWATARHKGEGSSRTSPHTQGQKTTTFAGHLATFHARSKGSDGHATIFTCRAAVDVASRFAFPGWYRVVRVGPSARSRLVAI